jgi:DNA polymerase-3 subunit alpha
MPRTPKKNFVHLHNHTQYSLLDGASRIDELMQRAARFRMPAVAITDHGNLFGVPRFYQKAIETGVKPILGCEVYVAPGDRRDQKTSASGKAPYFHLTLLAEDRTGYQNLMRLVSISYLEGFYYRPRIDKETLAQHSKGLIGLSGCLSGEVPRLLQADRFDDALRTAGEYTDILGRDGFYMELQDHGIAEQKKIFSSTIEIGRRLDLPLVATNDCHFLDRSDHFAHDVLICIQTGKTVNDASRMIYTDRHHFRSPDEMWASFGEVPEALENTLRIAERCHCTLETGAHHLPRFEVPQGKVLEDYFREVVEAGYNDRRPQWDRMRADGAPIPADEVYRQRLQVEIEMIGRMGFPGYFLIVWDFVRFARDHHIPVGPGRGSAAGSLVAYCLGITDIDPLRYGLLFERFLNPERVTLPDIDIDFCIKGRGRVIDYVTEKYGRDNVAQIITFGRMAAKAVIRDVGRGLDIPYSDVDRIAKLIPNDLDATIAGSVKSVPQLKQAADTDERIGRLLEVARRLEGLTRHASTHAAGVVISPRPLVEFTPLYRGKDGEVLTQYAMNEIEAIGLLKMDFLGLKTLTLIDNTLKRLEASGRPPIDLDGVPLNDGPTYELFSHADTSGIFQFESAGMKDILRKMKPDRFEDLIALNALYRPGPIKSGMIDEFIRRRRGQGGRDEKMPPQLAKILDETHGVIVFQEQVMRIASELAGFSLGEADLLRRAMGKKKREVMSAQKTKFLEGARKNRISENESRKIFDLMAHFAEYGFNKSHSAAYALIAYRTAYLKAHFPVSFMAALLTSEKENTDNVGKYIRECRDMSIPILPPDIHRSDLDFTEDDGRIRFGLNAIKNVGENAIRSILAARNEAGRFRDLGHLCQLVDLRLVNRRVLEALIKSGGCDGLGSDRAAMFRTIERYMEIGQKEQEARLSGQSGLFDTAADGSSPPAIPVDPGEPWDDRERLAFEKDALGFYLTGHPLEDHREMLAQLATHTTARLGGVDPNRKIVVVGMITGLRKRKTRRGDLMATCQLEDLEGAVETILFPKVYQECRLVLELDEPVLVTGKLEEGSESPRLLAESAVPLEGAEQGQTDALTIRLTTTGLGEETLRELDRVLAAHPGGCPIYFDLRHPKLYRLRVRAGTDRQVRPSRDLAVSIEKLVGKGSVRFHLRPR